MRVKTFNNLKINLRMYQNNMNKLTAKVLYGICPANAITNRLLRSTRRWSFIVGVALWLTVDCKQLAGINCTDCNIRVDVMVVWATIEVLIFTVSIRVSTKCSMLLRLQSTQRK